VLIFDSFVVTFTSLILLSTSLAWIYLTVDSPLPLSIVGLCYILSSEEYLVYFVIIAGLFFMNTVSRILPFITSQASGFLPLNQFKSVSISIDVKEITSGSVPTTNISLHRDFLPLIVLFVLQVSPLNQFKFDLFERLLLVEVKLCLWCTVTLVWIDLGVIFNSILKVVCECVSEGLFVVAKRSKEVVCRCMSCCSQSEELMAWKWF